MENWGIILAAGLGVRFGSPKAFFSLAGKPILQYSLTAFQNAGSIQKMVVVCRQEDIEAVQALARSASILKLQAVAPGGKERQDSVLQGLQVLPDGVKVVAVHDAARPLVSVKLIEAVVQAALEKGAVIPAVPIKDTIKQVRENRVEKTLNRMTLQAAQTPQAFHVELLRQALQQAMQEDFYGTDCASLVDRIGQTVYTVEGSPENLKITTPLDLQMAEAILHG